VTTVQAKITTLIVCAAVILAMLGVTWWHMETTRHKIFENNALTAASSYADTLVTLRAYYTREVISRLPEDSVTVTRHYRETAHAVPLPATLTIQLAEELGRKLEGFSARLYSNHPFPWRKETSQQDDFEKRAIQKLTESPDEPYYEFEKSPDGGYLRYAAADIMQPACVACHNSNPQSPKRDWEVGDLVGVLSISMPMHVSMKTITDTYDYLIFFFIVGGVIILATVIWAMDKR
jgi:hypothetical protein